MATVVFDDTELKEAFADINRVLERLPIDDTMFEIERQLEQDHREFFDKRQSPAGEAWGENWRPYARYKNIILGHEFPLLFSGKLEGSMTGVTGDSIREQIRGSSQLELIFGTSLPYAGKMESGGPSFFGLFGVTIDITPRPFAGFKQERPDTIANAVADALVEAMKA